MPLIQALATFRAGRRAVGETYQALAAVTVVIVCAGLVLAAVSYATQDARTRAARDRATLQADIALEALETDPILMADGGAVSWAGAMRIASGAAVLAFKPADLRVLTVRALEGEPDLFLFGDAHDLQPSLVFATRSVVIETADGDRLPGLAKAGVVVD